MDRDGLITHDRRCCLGEFCPQVWGETHTVVRNAGHGSPVQLSAAPASTPASSPHREAACPRMGTCYPTPAASLPLCGHASGTLQTSCNCATQTVGLACFISVVFPSSGPLPVGLDDRVLGCPPRCAPSLGCQTPACVQVRMQMRDR